MSTLTADRQPGSTKTRPATRSRAQARVYFGPDARDEILDELAGVDPALLRGTRVRFN
jgi:hypothetical protein